MRNAVQHWLIDQTPKLIQLAQLHFDRLTHEAFCKSVGWKVFREDWYPDVCFEVHFQDVDLRLIAVYEEPELGLGIGLGALAGENDGYCVETVAEYDEAFRETLAVIEPLFKAAAIVGQYADRMAGRVTTMRTGRLTIRS